MISCLRTDSAHPDFQQLISELDAYLAIVNGTENEFFVPFNKVNQIHHVLVAYEDDTPVGCGAIKAYADDAMEVKRMFVKPAKRGQGVASCILLGLEDWARELNYKRCVLETSETMRDAIQLYTKNQYLVIPNYGPYTEVVSSVCFEKTLM